MGEKTKYIIRKMTLEDIDGVYEVEKSAFLYPWSKELIQSEFDVDIAHYIVIEKANKILGYAGFWLVVDEAQVINIVIHHDFQNKGLGAKLVTALIDLAIEKKASIISLEVGQLNDKAQNLYKKAGFTVYGKRNAYYENKEDAFLMHKRLFESKESLKKE